MRLVEFEASNKDVVFINPDKVSYVSERAENLCYVLMVNWSEDVVGNINDVVKRLTCEVG